MLQGDVGPGEILFCEQNKKIVLRQMARCHTMMSLGTIPEQFHTWCFIQHQDSILCEVTGNPQYSRDLSTPNAKKLALVIRNFPALAKIWCTLHSKHGECRIFRESTVIFILI